jgi:capsular exopolysaccharide synthesis family protein
VTLLDPQSSAAEAFRVLRTSIQLAVRQESQPRLLITSAGAGEGKSTVASNLAITLAQAGKTVVLCDLDLRRPSAHVIFGVPNHVGLSALILNPDLPLDAALLATAEQGLWLLPSGPVPANPSEMLTSEVMQDRLDQLARHADVLIFDSPGVLPVADTQIIAGFASGAVLVADRHRTRRAAVQRATVSLEKTGVRILGVVLNRANDASLSHAYYGPEKVPTRSRWLQLSALVGTILGLHR